MFFAFSCKIQRFHNSEILCFALMISTYNHQTFDFVASCFLDVQGESTCSIPVHPIHFHNNHGKNIGLCNENMTASRTASYNQAVVISDCPLPRRQLFEVRQTYRDVISPFLIGDLFVLFTPPPSKRKVK